MGPQNLKRGLAAHIVLSEQSVSPDLPQLRLELGAKNKSSMSLTLPYLFDYMITRQDDPADKPIIFEWHSHVHGLAKLGFVLLHHTASNFEKVPLDRSCAVDRSRHEPLVVGRNSNNLEQAGPEASILFREVLPEQYQKILQPGETYTLLWPGGRLATWNYGTKNEHVGQELKDREEALILPGGAHITFSAHAEIPPWPKRAKREAKVGFRKASFAEIDWRSRRRGIFPPPMERESERGAPNLSVIIECSSTFRYGLPFKVAVNVTYQAEAYARPIIFDTRLFTDDRNYQLGEPYEGVWEIYDHPDSDVTGFMFVDDPDVPVNVSENDRFFSLRPGESWTTSQRLLDSGGTMLPDDADAGEIFVIYSMAIRWIGGTGDQRQIIKRLWSKYLVGLRDPWSIPGTTTEGQY